VTDEKEDPRPTPDPPHPLDGGAVHGHHAPEVLSVEAWLKRLAASEDHLEEEKRRRPPRGKL
jgi:hypothetical protein